MTCMACMRSLKSPQRSSIWACFSAMTCSWLEISSSFWLICSMDWLIWSRMMLCWFFRLCFWAWALSLLLSICSYFSFSSDSSFSACSQSLL